MGFVNSDLSSTFFVIDTASATHIGFRSRTLPLSVVFQPLHAPPHRVISSYSAELKEIFAYSQKAPVSPVMMRLIEDATPIQVPLHLWEEGLSF
jgi:hypothetical protein